MSFGGRPSARPAEDFRRHLQLLVSKNRGPIKQLTELAHSNVTHAEAIAGSLADDLEEAAPHRKLPLLYLVDSICRMAPPGHESVCKTYANALAPRIVNAFQIAFHEADPESRKAIANLPQCWKVPFGNDVFNALDHVASSGSYASSSDASALIRSHETAKSRSSSVASSQHTRKSRPSPPSAAKSMGADQPGRGDQRRAMGGRPELDPLYTNAAFSPLSRSPTGGDTEDTSLEFTSWGPPKGCVEPDSRVADLADETWAHFESDATYVERGLKAIISKDPQRESSLLGDPNVMPHPPRLPPSTHPPHPHSSRHWPTQPPYDI
eukprot:GHVN01081312.1.p1 GENE.GHVN01081312.1~~GHVN01081312.1.p1  ORF type:complete len:323 (+),score=48.59 GHVN01081312.1:794-1762(+)